MKKHFTLSDLIAIGATLLVLASAALPLLAAVNAGSRNSACQNKLKMQGSAIALYAEDNNDYLISGNVYSDEQANNHLRNNYDSSKVRSGRIVLMKQGYFGQKEVIRNGAEQLAARKKYYQCPDDNKVFSGTFDSYYLLYYTEKWVPYSYRFGKVDYARDLASGAGDPGNIIACDAGIYSVDAEKNQIIHAGFTNALTLDGAVLSRDTTQALKQKSIINALRFGAQFGNLDNRTK
ncbi:MAG: hypothetical protein E7047_02835 [Lentisphaerae bacterium]|nr:hypothetical protein [Lentisphaerota bacterium]